MISPYMVAAWVMRSASHHLRALWQPGYRNAKAGAMLYDLRPEAGQPRMLFPTRDPVRSARAMAAMDAVNACHGAGTVRPLATGLARPWAARAARLSPRYNTRLKEILVATAW